MTFNLKHSLGVYVLALTTLAALAQATGPSTAKQKAAPAKDVDLRMQPPERAFMANCSRCHYAPESLSPRITGTVVRHMRVRANLSAEDERLILQYLNP